MHPSRALLPLCLCALAALCAGTGAWALQHWHGGVGLAPLVALAGAAQLVFIGPLAYLKWRADASQDQARRSLESLLNETSGTSPGDSMPRGWQELIERLSRTVNEARSRAEHAESQRTALEFRARRAAAECERLTAILENLGEPLLVVDGYDELVLANASAERLFHFASPDPERRALARLVRCERLIGLLDETRRRDVALPPEELELVDAQGASRWYSVSAQALPAPGEQADAARQPREARSAMAVLRDISPQKAIQRRHAEFVSAVSHEMKTPLSGIKAYVELLADGEAQDDVTRDEFLAVIDSQADRLQRLIDNLLNLSRIEAGVVQVQKRALPLNELLQEAARLVRPAAEEKRITLASELSPMYLGVLADRDQLLQAAINLLSNAVKYTPEAGRVTLRSRLRDERVEFSVEDTGVGLSPEDQTRIFEKFYRVAKDQKMAAGTGLGLALARSIVEDVHGGRLSVSSQPNVGSVFTVSLPRAGQTH